MKMKYLMVSLAAVSCVLFSSCGGKKGGEEKSAAEKAAAESKVDTPEVIVSEVADNMEELVTILKSVTDDASADAAVEKLNALGDEMVALSERAKKVPEPSEEQKKELDKMLKTKLDSMKDDIGAAIGTLMTKPELAKKVMTAMEGFGAKMDSAEEGFKRLGKDTAEEEDGPAEQ